MHTHIRKATADDLCRIAEIIVFNYRLYFYPIFQSDDFYFGELQVNRWADAHKIELDRMWVYDDGVVKGFVQVNGAEIQRLFVEPVLHNRSIGSALLRFAMDDCRADRLWALEKNENAIRFYKRHGFSITGERKSEDGTDEHLVLLIHR